MNELNTRMKIRTTPEAAYEAFIDPGQLARFWFTYSSRRWESGITVQLGYAEYNAPPFDIELRELIPEKQIEFVWGDEAGSRLVTITFEPLGTGEIVAAVRESGYVEGPGTVELLVDSKAGWTFMLTCLKAYLENGISSLKLGLFID